MKITHGSWSRANPNISRTSRALSPMYLSTMALATTFKNVAFRLQARARAPFRGLLFGVKAGVRGVCGADSMRPRFDGVGFGGGEFSCDFDSSSCARERDACQWLLCLL